MEMTDDIVTRLGDCWEYDPSLIGDAMREIERLRKEVSKWATTPPNRMVCATHGEMFMCFDEYMDGVYWCDGCRND